MPLFGESDPIWDPYREPEEAAEAVPETPQKNDFVTKMVTAVKKMDVNQMNEQINKMSQSISSLQSLLNTFSGNSQKQSQPYLDSILFLSKGLKKGSHMRKEVQEYIFANEERKRFIREQPIWYRRLSRKPDDLSTFQLEMMNFYEKTIPHRVNQFTNGIQMAQMMMQMFQAMRTKD